MDANVIVDVDRDTTVTAHRPSRTYSRVVVRGPAGASARLSIWGNDADLRRVLTDALAALDAAEVVL